MYKEETRKRLLIKTIDIQWEKKRPMLNVVYDLSKGYVAYRNAVFANARRIGYIN